MQMSNSFRAWDRDLAGFKILGGRCSRHLDFEIRSGKCDPFGIRNNQQIGQYRQRLSALHYANDLLQWLEQCLAANR